jgi:nucleotide-binding universal stress UspA family protein
VAEPFIEEGDAAETVRRVAASVGAQMVVVGGGETETVVRWLLGNTAERIVRGSRQPVWIARGTMPGPGRRIVCPIDLSPQSRSGFLVALRMARLFDAPLRLVTVIPPERHTVYGAEELDRGADRLEEEARRAMRDMVAAHDTAGVQVEMVVLAGRPVSQVLDGSHDAHLLVIGSSGFDMLLPGTFGGTAEKILRGSWASVVAVRDSDPDRAQRESRIRHVAALKREAQEAMQADNPGRAELLLRSALDDADGNPALHEALAESLKAQGRDAEAADHRHVAAEIRRSIG